MNLLRVEEEENHVNEDSGDEEDVNEQGSRPQSLNFHYVWIKDLSRLVSRQLSKHDGRHIWKRCLHYFTSIEKLFYHSKDCKTVNDCQIVLPKPDRNIIEFKNFKYKEKLPFIIYADCKSLLKPVEDVQVKTSNTEVFQRHEVFGIGYYLKCSFDDALSSYRSCPDDEEPAKWFALELLGIAKECHKIFTSPAPMNNLTPEQQKTFIEATICHICGKALYPQMKKVRDHCHLTGMYFGAAHEHCNLEYQDLRIIPVMFHN